MNRWDWSDACQRSKLDAAVLMFLHVLNASSEALTRETDAGSKSSIGPCTRARASFQAVPARPTHGPLSATGRCKHARQSLTARSIAVRMSSGTGFFLHADNDTVRQATAKRDRIFVRISQDLRAPLYGGHDTRSTEGFCRQFNRSLPDYRPKTVKYSTLARFSPPDRRLQRDPPGFAHAHGGTRGRDTRCRPNAA
jgi:hypothetical protein